VDPPFDLDGYDGLAVQLRSDVAQRYKVILRDASGWDTVAWCHSVDLPAGQVGAAPRSQRQLPTADPFDRAGKRRSEPVRRAEGPCRAVVA
jgi:hypothetical protein